MMLSMGFDWRQANLALKANMENVDSALKDLLSGKHFSATDRATEPAASISETNFYGGARMKSTELSQGERIAKLALAEVLRKRKDESASALPPQHPGRSTSIGDSVLSTTLPTHRMGAHAVAGPQIRGHAPSGDLEAGDYHPAYICNGSELVAATEVGTESRRGLTRPALLPEMVTAELESDESYTTFAQPSYRPCWTKRRILVTAVIALLLVLVGGFACSRGGAVGAVAVTLLAINKRDEDKQQEPGGAGEPDVGGGETEDPSTDVPTEAPIDFTDNATTEYRG